MQGRTFHSDRVAFHSVLDRLVDIRFFVLREVDSSDTLYIRVYELVAFSTNFYWYVRATCQFSHTDYLIWTEISIEQWSATKCNSARNKRKQLLHKEGFGLGHRSGLLCEFKTQLHVIHKRFECDGRKKFHTFLPITNERGHAIKLLAIGVIFNELGIYIGRSNVCIILRRENDAVEICCIIKWIDGT